MASTIKIKQVNVAGNKMLTDVGKALGVTEDDIKSYDHCQSQEEVDLEIYGELLQEGKSPEVAEDLAREMAGDLWAAR